MSHHTDGSRSEGANMSAKNRFDGFTLHCLLAGLGLGLVGCLYYLYLNVFVLDRMDEMRKEFGTVVAVVLMGLAGAGVQYLSAGIEDSATSSTTRAFILMSGGILAFTLAPTGIVVFIYASLDNAINGPGSSLQPSFSGTFWMIILGFVWLIMIIPAIICWIVMFPLAFGLAAGGIFCLPRLLYYYSVRHPVLQAWEDGKQEGAISPQDISRGLGNPARNMIEARKLKSDLERLECEINQQQAQLEKDRDALRSAILGDVERFETEKRISSMLRNVDVLQAEVTEYREYMQKAGKK